METHAFARAGLLGNPSDGYFGRTLSVALPGFRATATLEAAEGIHVGCVGASPLTFESVAHLVRTVRERGYGTTCPLVLATIKTFHDHCAGLATPIEDRGLSISFASDIPRQVGLAGSSAIVTASLRALMSFFEVKIPPEQQANLALAAEVDELGITAGLQDRVAQVYEGLVYMDFSRDLMGSMGHGAYEPLDPALLPGMYLAYRTASTKVSGQVLDDVRDRWEAGDPDVHHALSEIADLATAGREALLRGDWTTFSSLMDTNFDLRRRIMHVDELDLAVVDAARGLGASAKLTGSGGAVVGVSPDQATVTDLRDEVGPLGVRVMELPTSAGAAP